MTDYSTELAHAKEFAALGARIAMGHYRTNPKRQQKLDGTWVTEADWAAEAQIRLRISRTFPDHNILGEEEGLTAAGGGPPVDGAPTWVIDPIDGTHNFMTGIPIWATLVALRMDNTNVVGVCHAPAIQEVYDGALGSGARMNDETIEVGDVEALSDATVLATGAEVFEEFGLSDFYSALVNGAWRSRGFGEFWGHMLVARGAAHVMVEPELSLWDVAAVDVIVTEAGGRTTHLDGTQWTSAGSCLTTNGLLHDEVVALMGSFFQP